MDLIFVVLAVLVVSYMVRSLGSKKRIEAELIALRRQGARPPANSYGRTKFAPGKSLQEAADEADELRTTEQSPTKRG